MKLFAAIFVGCICFLFTACQTTLPATSNNDVLITSNISIIVQCRNVWYAEPDLIKVVGQIASFRNVTIMENAFLFSEMHITCFRLSEGEIDSIQERLRQINGVINVTIKKI